MAPKLLLPRVLTLMRGVLECSAGLLSMGLGHTDQAVAATLTPLTLPPFGDSMSRAERRAAELQPNDGRAFYTLAGMQLIGILVYYLLALHAKRPPSMMMASVVLRVAFTLGFVRSVVSDRLTEGMLIFAASDAGTGLWTAATHSAKSMVPSLVLLGSFGFGLVLAPELVLGLANSIFAAIGVDALGTPAASPRSPEALHGFRLFLIAYTAVGIMMMYSAIDGSSRALRGAAKHSIVMAALFLAMRITETLKPGMCEFWIVYYVLNGAFVLALVPKEPNANNVKKSKSI